MGGKVHWNGLVVRDAPKIANKEPKPTNMPKNWHREFIPRNALTYIEQPLTITLDDLKPQIKANTPWPHWDVTLG